MSCNIENDSRYRAATLGALLARHYPAATPHSIALVVAEMQLATARAKKFAEDYCNYDLGDPNDARSSYARRRRAQDKRESTINIILQHSRLIEPEYHSPDDVMMRQPLKGAKHIQGATVDTAATVNLGGDPRGVCGRLIIPGQRGDGWGDGFAIY